MHVGALSPADGGGRPTIADREVALPAADHDTQLLGGRGLSQSMAALLRGGDTNTTRPGRMPRHAAALMALGLVLAVAAVQPAAAGAAKPNILFLLIDDLGSNDMGWSSRWRDCHSAAPPSPFSRCMNSDGERASPK